MDQHPVDTESEFRIIINHHPEYERYYSVKTGLSGLHINHSVFIHNADNPFANFEVLNALYINRNEADLIKPAFNKKGGHPILISPKIINDILSNENHDIYLNNFLNKFLFKKIETRDESILVNVNTKGDYKKLM